MTTIQITQEALRAAMLTSPGCAEQAWELLKADSKTVNLADVHEARISGELPAPGDGVNLHGPLVPGQTQGLQPGEVVVSSFDDAVQTKVLLVDDNGLVTVAVESTSKREDAAGYVYDIGGESLLARLEFHRGPLPLNGITNESLLVVLIDRTEILDKLYPCAENKAALKGMRGALAAFNARTEARKARGVEGKQEV